MAGSSPAMTTFFCSVMPGLDPGISIQAAACFG
jgi:hypothetical protein